MVKYSDIYKNHKNVYFIMQKLFVLLTLVALTGCRSGCRSQESRTVKPTVKPITSLDEMQGKWKVVEATDPQGNGFEAHDIEISIEGNKANSQGEILRIELAADNSSMKLFATVNGTEKQVGEVIPEITTEAQPTQMIWMDKINIKQVSLLERIPNNGQH
jgi:hypothetical protein